jgi:transcription elongation factor GreB
MAPQRPAAAPRCNYITPDGAAALRAELEELWRRKRPEITRTVAEAAAQGDRSENAEYIYGKKQLREIDRRIRFLRKRLEVLRIVYEPPADRSRIYFGAWAELVDERNRAHRFRLVGPDEAERASSYLSLDSPLARSLLGKRVADEVGVETPEGIRRYTVKRIDYDADERSMCPGPGRGKKKPGTGPGESQGKVAMASSTADEPN